MELTTQIFQFILSISILVVLHELGHFYQQNGLNAESKNFTFSLTLGFHW